MTLLNLHMYFLLGGKPTERGMIAEPLPSWLKDSIFSKFSQLEIFNNCSKFKLPNHCLINEYESGQGIMVSEYEF